MKKISTVVVIFFALVLSACSSTQSLQEYYVDNTENPNFLFLDVPASILNLEEANLTETQRAALSSLKKLNILAFKKTIENSGEYKIEKTNIKAILDREEYTELMKMNTEFGRATIKYLGAEDAIDEVIIFGDNKEKGFALVRVLGKNMNPANFMQLMQAVQKSSYKGEGLSELGELFKG
ncbi:DUF4252 domain-containing protein [Maribacter aestuarii]|uniref:DUF4252 domain-containing protein n=1 Tax=Maribacter aestuarii TaxID=1130723 RepID=UPI00248BA357|nr:DUF4252 domain-containing protein [Maribacter aestuarii]